MKNYGAIRLSRPFPDDIPASWRDLLPGKASDFIQTFKVEPAQEFILCLRVSSRQQDHSNNLDGQELVLREAVESGGGKVIDVFRFVESGFYPEMWTRAAYLAKKCGVTLLAESTDRFIRHFLYHAKKRSQVQATLQELEELRRATYGVPLMTLAHPDALPGEVRSAQSKRGQTAKDNTGGRPAKVIKDILEHKPGYKKNWREFAKPLVLEMRQLGISVPEICRQTDVPRATVYRWVAQEK